MSWIKLRWVGGAAAVLTGLIACGRSERELPVAGSSQVPLINPASQALEQVVEGSLGQVEGVAGGGVTSQPAPLQFTAAPLNRTAYIPPQCYVETQDEAGRVHNPCFTCHVDSRSPNYAEDAELQLDLSLPEPARKNPWSNLFRERGAVPPIPAEEVLGYVRVNNFVDAAGHSQLKAALAALPGAWDVDNNGRWDGYVPDAHYKFDQHGYDRDAAGGYSGWRALAYYPLPGAFMPTNGSMGDVLVRLPPEFRELLEGQFDETTYSLNLAIVEAMIKREDVPIERVLESRFGVDLDGDGRLGYATRVRYAWQPLKGRKMSYVGRAREAKTIPGPSAGLFPAGTEFLHSVRYLDVTEQGVKMAARMKELRYARKHRYQGYSALSQLAFGEAQEKTSVPDRIRQIRGNSERGVTNGQGWTYQAFIEDAAGQLRPQTYEELTFCVGCHSGIGATTDANFSFPRKLQEPGGGWYHWSQAGLKDVPEPKRADGRYEYSLYLEQNGAGDDFRSNEEVLSRFFEADGSLKASAIAALHTNVEALLLPSKERALRLDEAYIQLVREQSFSAGRDTLLGPVANAHHVAKEQATGIPVPVTPNWAELKR